MKHRWLGAVLFLAVLSFPERIFAGEVKTFLAIDVAVQGDAGSWRWWCSSPEDPLVIKAWRGFASGLDEEKGVEVISQFEGERLKVHPMYCKETLDLDMARNLAGLLGAQEVRVGRLELSEVKSHSDPPVHTVVLRYREKLNDQNRPGPSLSAKDRGRKAKPLWAERNVAAIHALEIPDEIESGARDLALQVGRLSAQIQAASRRLRSQLLVVADLTHQEADSWLLDRLGTLLPKGIRVDAEGFRGDSAFFRISAPRSNSGDLIQLLRTSIDAEPNTSFLVFEGTSVDGLPVFRAVGAPLSPWTPVPESKRGPDLKAEEPE